MSEFNPYAAPKIEVTARVEGEQDVWSDGTSLFLTRGAVLPDRCVKCDAETGGYKLKRNLSWHHPLLYLLVFVNLLIYIIVALIVRKTARVDVGLCPRHRSRRLRAILIGWLGSLGGIAMMISAAIVNQAPASGFLVAGGLVMLLFSLFYGLMIAQVVRPTKIDDRLVTLRGIGPAYLAHFTGLKPAGPVEL